MRELMSIILAFIGIPLVLVSLFIAYFLSNKRLWLAIVCDILCGLFLGIFENGLPIGLLSGFVIGIFIALFVILSGLLNKYYRKKGWEIIRKRYRR